ncbi:hypothetical protein D3C75_224540 [compost metagenome]
MTAEVKVTKMDLARVLFKEIFTRGYDLKGKTQRKTFIDRAMAEQGLSKHCAGTYYQNLTNEANGQPLYKYNKNKPKKVVTKAEVATMTEQLLALTHQAAERWFVVNAEGVEVHNFKTRGEAQKFAKDNDLEWKDRTKAA